MRAYFLPLLLCLTATVVAYAPLPAQAEFRNYMEVSGLDSIRLDEEGLEVLESIGLSFVTIENTAEPKPGYPYAIAVIPPTSNPPIFSYDAQTGEFRPISGKVDIAGSILFDVDTTKLNLPPQLEFRELFSPFSSLPLTFATGTVPNLSGAFDIIFPPNPIIADLEAKTIELEGVELRGSQEFNDYLVAAGASKSIVGLRFAEIRVDRGIVEIEATQVSEPGGSVLAILTAASTALAVCKRRQAA